MRSSTNQAVHSSGPNAAAAKTLVMYGNLGTCRPAFGNHHGNERLRRTGRESVCQSQVLSIGY